MVLVETYRSPDAIERAAQELPPWLRRQFRERRYNWLGRGCCGGKRKRRRGRSNARHAREWRICGGERNGASVLAGGKTL